MSNRQRRAGPEGMRDYARQKLAGHTRLGRHEYIADIVAYARRNGADELLAERTARYAWDSRWGQLAPAPENVTVSVPEPVPLPFPVPLASELPPMPGPQPTYSFRELLQRAEEQPLPASDDEQLVYEQALLALNKNVDAMLELKDWAAREGLTVEALARRIVDEHETRRREATRAAAAKIRGDDDAAG